MSRFGGGELCRFRSSLDLDKPDTKAATGLSGLGSPVSPLRTRPAASSSSSSSGSVGKLNAATSTAVKSAVKSYSGELSGSSDSSPVTNPKPGHRRSGSGPLIFSTASSPAPNVLPAGNICPSGRIAKTGMLARSAARSDVLGSGTGNYGHGSIMRGGGVGKSSSQSEGLRVAGGSGSDPHEVTRLGNECYKKGMFGEALRYYDRAVEICPGNAACRNNRAAALTGLGRVKEAVRECEAAVKLDPGYGRAHHRLALLHLRLGQVASAQKHLFLTGQQPDPLELRKVHAIERHLGRCGELRKIGDWKSALREADAAIAAGADCSPLLIASRAEALLRLHRIVEADSNLSSLATFESSSLSYSESKFFGMESDSYIYIVRAQIEMTLGRFENAVSSAEKARKIDSTSVQVNSISNTVKSVARARAQGNELFKSGNFAEASTAYGEGLRHDPLNPVLYCNRAVCRAKLEQWERSIEDCNEALKIQPSYIKALLRRAASYEKLERWAEAVRDYELLRKELPADTDVAESLFHAQVALKTSRGEEVSNMKFGGEVEEISGVEQFQAAISLTGVSVVYFMAAANQQCAQMSPFVDTLCTRYPSLNFLKVDVKECGTVAKSENVRIVPTFKIYKNGSKVKEMICPSQQVLDYSVRHYGL